MCKIARTAFFFFTSFFFFLFILINKKVLSCVKLPSGHVAKFRFLSRKHINKPNQETEPENCNLLVRLEYLFKTWNILWFVKMSKLTLLILVTSFGSVFCPVSSSQQQQQPLALWGRWFDFQSVPVQRFAPSSAELWSYWACVEIPLGEIKTEK